MLPRRWMEAYIRFLLHYRWPVLALALAVTLFLASQLAHTTIQMDFLDLYPPSHPYLQLSKKHARMFGSSNVLIVVVEVKDGDIFTVETLNKIDRLTTALMAVPGVNPWQVLSISHPKVRNIQVTGAGIDLRPLFAFGPPKTATDVARIKKAVYTNDGILDFLVSRDNKAALITAGFWESGLNFARISERLFQLQAQETDANHRLYLTGFPVLFCWIFSYQPWIFVITGLTVLAIAALLWFYFRTLPGVLLPLFSGGLSTVWALGFAGFLGFTIDLLMIVVFLLITARALSHSVQSMERYQEEYFRLGDKDLAIRQSYLSLFSPALVAIASDGLAILSLAVAHIAAMRQLAILSSFWIFTISVSVVTLHPILLSLLLPPRRDAKVGRRLSSKIALGINRALVKLSRGSMRFVTATSFALILLIGLYYSRQLKIGDISVGKALFYANHPYNVAYDRVIEKGFVGIAQLTIIAEGHAPGTFRQIEALNTLERFQRYLEHNSPLAGGSFSGVDVIRQLYQMFEEGVPKWAMLPSEPRHIGNLLGFFLQTAGAPGLERLVDKDLQNATLTVYFRDDRRATVVAAIRLAKEYIEANPVDNLDFRLACGVFGMLAAVNDEVEWSYQVNLYLVLATVFVLSFLTYRSLAGALIVMIPSIVAQPLTEAIMYWTGIDMNLNSLPVAAIGIGIGIDYGYYVLSRITEEYEHCLDIDLAIAKALMTTGRAILFTGATLTTSVIFWLFFPMKFQAEMAFLLTVILFLHVVGALVFIPSMVSLFQPRFATARTIAALADTSRERPSPINMK
ncbi:MAG: MMPL family transporter [Deltaproteobacteria bacterium]|nr:MMPL family transporter [Deltaproteobacteria bacterium]